MSTLEIKNLHAQVLPTEEGGEPKEILKGVNLTINSGETHAIMGPNGSGKSTLAYTLSGHPSYEVTEGEVLLDGEPLDPAGRRRHAGRRSGSRPPRGNPRAGPVRTGPRPHRPTGR
mgnify:CR=1 FL=1